MKKGFKKQWFLHPNWERANDACIEATGGGLYKVWDLHLGCTSTSTRGWMTYSMVAQSIASLCFGEDQVMRQG